MKLSNNNNNKNSFFKCLLLVLLISIPLSIANVKCTWNYINYIKNPVSIDSKLDLGYFDYPTINPGNNDYITDFGPEDNEIKSSFETMLGDKSDDPNNRTGLQNANSAISKVIDSMKNNTYISSVDKTPTIDSGNKYKKDFNIKNNMSFIIHKISGTAESKFVDLYITNTPLFTNNDYINGNAIYKDGDIINNIFKCKLQYKNTYSNTDINEGYNIISADKGYCNAGIFTPSKCEKTFFIPSTWKHGCIEGLKIVEKTQPTFNYNSSFTLDALDVNNRSVNATWTSSSTMVSVNNGNVNIKPLTNDLDIVYNTITISARLSSTQYATYCFRINNNKFPDVNIPGLFPNDTGYARTPSGGVQIYSMPQNGYLYTNASYYQGLCYYLYDSSQTINVKIKTKSDNLIVKFAYYDDMGKVSMETLTTTLTKEGEYNVATYSLKQVGYQIEYYLNIKSHSPIQYFVS